MLFPHLKDGSESKDIEILMAPPLDLQMRLAEQIFHIVTIERQVLMQS